MESNPFANQSQTANGEAAPIDIGVGTPLSIAGRVLDEFYSTVAPRDWPPQGDENDPRSQLLKNAVVSWQDDNVAIAMTFVGLYLQDSPDDYRATQLHAALAVSQGEYEKVEQVGRRMIELDEASADAHIWHGLACLMLQRVGDAVDSLTRAVELNDASVWAKVARGLALIVDGRPFGANQEFEDALRDSSDFVPALLGSASAEIAAQRFDYAFPYANRVLEIEPDNATALTLRGDCYVAQSDFARAIADYERALEIVGTDSGLTLRAVVARVQQHQAAQGRGNEGAAAEGVDQGAAADPSEQSGNVPVLDWLQRMVWPQASPKRSDTDQPTRPSLRTLLPTLRSSW